MDRLGLKAGDGGECLRMQSAGCIGFAASGVLKLDKEGKVNVTTLAELEEIVLTEAQKSLHAHRGYNGAVRIHSVSETSGLPNWTIKAFDPWSPNFEGCREALRIAEHALKNCYRVVG
jgi:hypothetical protein